MPNSKLAPTGIVLVCGQSSGGEIIEAESLRGLQILSVCGVGEKSYALTEVDAFDVDTGEAVGVENPKSISSGVGHIVSVTCNGDLYSWGTGEYGELGLGPKYSEVTVPVKIPHSSHFTSVSCGDFHSVALDERGNIYSWGQNFNRQLGLYKKSGSDLPVDCVVENLMMVPKFVPLSLSCPVKSIACGSLFTLAVSQNGDVWSWGAGESGQLGSGRVTVRDRPEICIPKSVTTEHFKDVACGYGHAMALTENGRVFCWGINVKGQLGQGDIKPRFTPVELELANGHAIGKVFAAEHSSACITENGALYTWGSDKHQRLMLDSDATVVTRPTAVSKVSGIVIESFAFARTQSMALIFTRLLEVKPLSGPQKTFSKLEIHGCGFWDSDSIVVRFTKKQDGPSMPRSSHGKYVKEGLITCRPPKLSDTGVYLVQLSLNGKDFSEDVAEVNIYPDPLVNSFASPALLDMRVDVDPVDIVLHCSKLGDKAFQNGVFIKLCDSLNPDKEPLVIEGMVQAPEKKRKDEEDDEDETSLHSSVENVRAQSVLPGEEEVIVLSRHADLSPLLGPTGDEDEAKCVMIKAQVSSNGIDFSEPGPEMLLCHRFHPSTLHPTCATFKGQREVLVTGAGLIPTSYVQIEAVHSLLIDSDEGEDGKVELEACVPVRCVDWNELSYTIPCIDDFFAGESFSPPAKNVLEVDVHFRLTTGEYLSTNAFTFQYYKSIAVDVNPGAIRRCGGTKLSISGRGVHFYSEAAKLVLVEKESGYVNTFEYDAFEELDGTGNGWTITCTSPAIQSPSSERNTDGMDENFDTSDEVPATSGVAYFGLLLDGISQPQDSKLTPLNVFNELRIRKESFPKGPSLMNSNLTLAVDGLVGSNICIIRIRNQEGAYVETDGTIDTDSEAISFVIPDTIPQLLPPGTSKNTSSYHVDICIDGSTFDNMEDALLQIKI